MALSRQHSSSGSLAFGNMKRSPSISSLSTRVSSTNSLVELPTRSQEFERQDPSGSALAAGGRRRLRLFLLAGLGAAFAGLGLWQRHIQKAARSSKPWGSKRAAALASALMALAAKHLLRLRRGSSDFQERPERVPTKQALVCMHPHGTFVMGNMAHLMSQMRGSKGSLQDLHVVGADAVFQVPGYGELMLLMNARCAQRRTLDELLSSGKQVALCPGGIHEQLRTDPKQEQLFFPPNLGFVRAAIRHGLPLVAMYNFGENQLFDVPAWSRPVSRWLKRTTGAGAPLGVGRHGLPFMPHPVAIETRIGRAVETGAPDSDPSDAKVEGIFRRYCQELHRLFDEHKAALPEDVAEKGLRLVWRGHEDVDLTPEGLASEQQVLLHEPEQPRGQKLRATSRLCLGERKPLSTVAVASKL